MLGISVYPTIAIAVTIVLVFEWWFDRIKLMRYCKPVLLTNNTFSHLLFWMNFVNVLVAMLIPPNGVLWILIGYNQQCTVVAL
jgi:hypothetical protein